jgi:2-polyprenyl-6-methoxyphenol hydroxylase-like FAD-dependent oxidoreductase
MLTSQNDALLVSTLRRSWSKGHVTMIGDAVHPMMPNLGQGGCQAIEDGFVLANRLGELSDRSQVRCAHQMLVSFFFFLCVCIYI